MSLISAFEKQKETVVCGLCTCNVQRSLLNRHRRGDQCKRSKRIITIDLDDDKQDVDTNFSQELTADKILSPEESLSEESESQVFHPYYSRIFLDIVGDVIQRPKLQHLFNVSDKDIITAFFSVSGKAQKLFVRLFLRKDDWLPASKLIYRDIDEDMVTLLQILLKGGLLITLGNETADLAQVLKLLSAKDLKDLSKTYKIASDVKSNLIKSLLSMCSNQKSVFGSLKKSMLKKAMNILGTLYRIREDVRCVFVRVLIVYAPTEMQAKLLFNQPSLNLAQQLLFNILQSESGALQFPLTGMKIQLDVLFSTRDHLLLYKGAMDLQMYIARNANSNDSDTLTLIVNHGKGAEEALRAMDYTDLIYGLCDWWLPYTSAWIYTSIVSHTVEVLQKLRHYKEANEKLEFLLRDDEVAVTLCTKYRGHWWDRLALNQDAHLKDKQQALVTIEKALNDVHVKDNCKFALISRKERLTKTAASNPRNRKRRVSDPSSKDLMTSLKDLPTITIEGRILRKNLGYSSKQNHFIAPNSAEDVTVCNVEGIALTHYTHTTNQFEQGVHCEGSPWKALLCLICWEQIFDKGINKVWVSTVQREPLDIAHPLFYLNRKYILDRRLEWLASCSPEILSLTLESSWTEHFGVNLSLMSWESFESVSTLQAIAACCGGATLSKILKHLVIDLRHRQSGFPDLVLYSTTACKNIKVVEVKGPGDRLSSKQRLWLNFFLSIGVPAEVCLVEPNAQH